MLFKLIFRKEYPFTRGNSIDYYEYGIDVFTYISHEILRQ